MARAASRALLRRADGAAGERLRLERVGRRREREREQAPDERAYGVLPQQAVAALRDHHGIDDETADGAALHSLGDGLDDLSG